MSHMNESRQTWMRMSHVTYERVTSNMHAIESCHVWTRLVTCCCRYIHSIKTCCCNSKRLRIFTIPLHTHTYTYTHTHTHAHTHARTHTHTHAHIHTHTHTHTHTLIHFLSLTSTHTRSQISLFFFVLFLTRTYTYTHTHSYTHTHTRTHTRKNTNTNTHHTHTHTHAYDTRHIGERIRGRASAGLRVCNMIELVHAKLTHTYAAARRLSGMPRGLCYVDVFSVSDLFEPPYKGKGIEFPRKPAILADCTTIIIAHQTHGHTHAHN